MGAGAGHPPTIDRRHSWAGHALIILGILHLLRLGNGLAFVMPPDKWDFRNIVLGGGINLLFIALLIFTGMRVRRGRWLAGAIAIACLLLVGVLISLAFVFFSPRQFSWPTYVIEGAYLIWIVVTPVLIFRLIL